MEAWRWSVGTGDTKVTAMERPERGHTLWLRHRATDASGRRNWRWKALGEPCRTASGKLITAATERAMAEARALTLSLQSGVSAPTRPTSPSATRSCASAASLLTDPQTGRYPRPTAHRAEVLRALDAAVAVWGADKPWADLTRADWRALYRHRMRELHRQGHRALRGAELAVSRVWTVAQWLVEEGHVLRVTGPERGWRDALRAEWATEYGDGADPEPERPRHTLDEMRRIIEASEQGDPRFALLMALGAELRLGQVARCRRSDLNTATGELKVRGARQKKGALVTLTAGQVAAVERALGGYLARLDAECPDYPLFPAGPMPGGRTGRPVADPARHGQGARTIGRMWVLLQFRAAERRAGVPHITGRGGYGVRRAAVDAAKAFGISREALAAHGGWQDETMPDTIYAERHPEWARREAADTRAKIRGETAFHPAPNADRA